jgi:hypothetical protein
VHDDAGLQHLTTLQQLEVLRVPCDDAQGTARLAAQLPRLRSLDLRCCPMRCCAPEEAHEAAAAPLDLTAATALTRLRLHMCGGAAEDVKRLQMPPQLQVLCTAPCCIYVQVAVCTLRLRGTNAGRRASPAAC